MGTKGNKGVGDYMIIVLCPHCNHVIKKGGAPKGSRGCGLISSFEDFGWVTSWLRSRQWFFLHSAEFVLNNGLSVFHAPQTGGEGGTHALLGDDQ